MFVDTAKVHLEAGKGGDGAVSFRHEIYIPKGGPDGGDGGRGGSIIFKADKDTNTLLDFRYNPILKAANGKNGAGQRAAGRSGENLIVEVPIGTMVYKVVDDKDTDNGSGANLNGDKDQTTKNDRNKNSSTQHKVDNQPTRQLLADLTVDQQTAIIARGGDGGFGNAHFKSSTRQAPRIAEVGEPGEAFTAELELKLLADVGLVGLPNAGKSTFLSVVSNARPEIANYPFTTLTPNLGVATIDNHDLLIADIPGLIEGAAEGKGLGHDFLRHVDRTMVLLHLVDVYNDDAGAAYATIRHELEKYSDLATRPEIVALTKTEGLDQELIDLQIAAILRVNPEAQVYAISAQAHQGVGELLRAVDGVIIEVRLKQEGTGGTSPQGPFAGYDRERARRTRNDGLQRRVSRGERAYGSGLSQETDSGLVPTIKLSDQQLSQAWHVEKRDGVFYVTGPKIEKFARRTDLNNYASVNRLRDILKKLGIRAELTNQGAEPNSIISIAGKEFTLVEDY